MNNLSFDWNIVISFNFSFSSYVFCSFLWNMLRNVLSKILDSIIIDFSHLSGYLFYDSLLFILSKSSGSWNSINMLLISILNDFLFKRNIFNSTFSFNNLFSHINSCVNDLRLMTMNMSIYMLYMMMMFDL